MPVLNWIGKKAVVNHHREVPYRLLHCDKDKSVGDPDAGNLLVQGDNLEALKALLPYYAGKVKCIYIDPPYNTGNEGWVYNDNVNSPEIKAWLGAVVGREAEDLSRHDKWLCMMYPRLRLLKEFLRNDGSIWVNIDDNEAYTLKLLMDDVFGNRNFISSIVWCKRVSPANDAKYFSSDHDMILVYSKSKESWMPNRLGRTEKQNSYYKNPDNDARGPWNSATYTGNKSRAERPNLYYEIVNPNTGESVFPPDNLTWRYSLERHKENELQSLLYWGKDGRSKTPRLKMYLSDAEAVVPRSVWPYDDAGSTQTAMTEQRPMFGTPFPTPKPELLISRILEISSTAGDLILDSFAGSGTAGAAAHKMGRKHISVEMGDHAHTHIVPRYARVIDGSDQGGISKAVSWQGGSGFRFCTLGEPLFDADGNVSPAVTYPDLAAHVFFCETGSPIPQRADGSSPLIGTFQGRAIYLLHSANAIGIASAKAGNVLTLSILESLPPPEPGFDGSRVVYGEGCTVPDERLARHGVTFKQIPYQIEGL